MARTIAHADVDAFYASVEQLDNPGLRGQPVVVGGPPESRGVVMAASYEARAFGVRSAMPMVSALRRCPKAVRLPPRFDRYSQVSGTVMAAFRSLTPLVEPLSMDEAFLDATDVEGFANDEALGRYIKALVKERTGLVVSIGIGANKTIAKIASDAGKPDGLVVVERGGEAAFLAPLPVRALWGIGPKSEGGLARAGIRTIGDLAALDAAAAQRLLGSRAGELQAMARGEDDRPVETERELKSVGAETTFPRDLPDGPELRRALADIASGVARRLRRQELRARTVAIKLRYDDFRTITRQTSLAAGIDDGAAIAGHAGALLSKVADPDDRFRLIGIHCSNFDFDDEGDQAQLGLWESAD